MNALDLYRLRLYVTGRSHLSQRAIGNLRRMCEENLQGEYEMEVVDILDEPQAAEVNRILATPVVIKDTPPPRRRVLGDLSDWESVMSGLDMPPGRRT